MQELIGADLTVIANTGDDIEALGVHVSPDPDLCTYWLTGEIDADRGWGIDGRLLPRLRAAQAARRARAGSGSPTSTSRPAWSGAGASTSGERPTVVQRELARRARRRRARVLPMCDEPVRTRVRTPDGWREFQEYLSTTRRSRRSRRSSWPGSRRRAPTAGDPRGDRGGRRDRRRPLQPGDLDRPDPARCRDARAAGRRRPPRSSRSARSSAAR